MKKKALFGTSVALVVIVSFLLTIMIVNTNKYDFSAKSIDGDVTLSDFSDTYKIIYFGYTYCPDICPLSLRTLGEALKGVEDEVKLLFISLDPKRDNPQILQEYAEFFYPNALGLWIDDEALQDVAANYGITYERTGDSKDYFIAHSSSLFLFDKDGNLIDKINNLTQENIKDSVLYAIKGKR